jgi:hypothetical protein
MMKQTKKLITIAVLVSFMASLAPRAAFSDVSEEERDLSYLVDVGVLRPVGLVATVAGFALFVVTLPISIPTLSIEKSFDILVVNPARYTFARELGGEDINYDKREEYERQQKQTEKRKK